MKMTTTAEIRRALREAEKMGMNCYIQLDEADRKDTWARVFSVRNRHNRGTGETYIIVETLAGTKIRLFQAIGGNFDIR